MRVSTRLSILTGTALAAAGVAVAGAPAAAADPIGPTLTSAPISVHQIPAVGVQITGLGLPDLLFSSVNASSPGKGRTTFTLPVSDAPCWTSAALTLVRINYVNLANGTSGSTSLRPCTPYGSLPDAPTVDTGSGPVAITVAIVGAEGYPNAGQPSLPGIGGFVAP